MTAFAFGIDGTIIDSMPSHERADPIDIAALAAQQRQRMLRTGT